MKVWQLAAFAVLISSFVACGGGGGSSGEPPVAAPGVPSTQPQPSGSPPVESPTPVGTATPVGRPTPGQTSTPGATPTPSGTFPPSHIPNTVGRIGQAQIFDYGMSDSQIGRDASKIDIVWGSAHPEPWRASNSNAIVSRYYIIEEDNTSISGHDLSYWQQTHPDWIMYACDANGNPTHDFAYTPGVASGDVPLDIHNPAVIDYQIRQSLGPFLIHHAYSAAAFDEVIFYDVMLGGNPYLGQSIVPGEYGCGVWKTPSSFTRYYASRGDPQWNADVANWMATARRILKTDPSLAPYNLMTVVNHPVGSINDPNEQLLLHSVDATMNEAGFSDYGNYQQPKYAPIFAATLRYMKYVQSLGVAFVDIDKFASNAAGVTPSQIEYSLATYLMANEGSADLFVGAKNGEFGYGSSQYHSEYAIQYGTPCGETYGGPGYDASNPNIYYRRYTHALAVVNSGSLPVQVEYATLPSGRAYTDIEGRALTNPLPVSSNDAYVLTTSSGC